MAPIGGSWNALGRQAGLPLAGNHRKVTGLPCVAAAFRDNGALLG